MKPESVIKAVLYAMAFTLIGVVAVVAFAPEQHVPLCLTVIGAATAPTIGVFLSLLKSTENGKLQEATAEKLEVVHKVVNDHQTKLEAKIKELEAKVEKGDEAARRVAEMVAKLPTQPNPIPMNVATPEPLEVAIVSVPATGPEAPNQPKLES